MERTSQTIALNARIQIVNLRNYQFQTPKGICTLRGWGMMIPGKGFIKFKHDELPVPYSPIGGKKALQSIMESGGFLEYDSLEFVNPIN